MVLYSLYEQPSHAQSYMQTIAHEQACMVQSVFSTFVLDCDIHAQIAGASNDCLSSTINQQANDPRYISSHHRQLKEKLLQISS